MAQKYYYSTNDDYPNFELTKLSPGLVSHLPVAALSVCEGEVC